MAMVAFGIEGWGRAEPEIRADRHVLDADALETVADLPDDHPVKRLLKDHGIDVG